MIPPAMNILITGATGLVGMNLMHLLGAEDHRLVAIDKHEGNLRLAQILFPEIRFHCEDLSTNPDKWLALFEDVDCVIALHAQIAAPNTGPYIANNVTATAHVINACREHRIPHLIHISSSVVISVAEDDYTQTKAEGEKLVVQSGCPYTVLRPPLMYGCFDNKHMGFLLHQMRRFPALPFPGSGRYIRQPLYVEDLCQVILSALKNGPNQTCSNVIGLEHIDFIDMLKEMARVQGIHCPLIKLPIPVFVSLLKLYSTLTGSAPFVPEQLTALMAGDEFPVSRWPEYWNVLYTPFELGIRKTIEHPLYPYSAQYSKA